MVIRLFRSFELISEGTHPHTAQLCKNCRNYLREFTRMVVQILPGFIDY